MKWWNRARSRFLLLSLGADFFLIVLLAVMAYWANRPIKWPSDPLAPRYFFSFYMTIYGWLLTALGSLLLTVFQVALTQFELKHLDLPLRRRKLFNIVVIIVCVCIVTLLNVYLDDIGKAYFLSLAVGVLLIGAWPSYMLIRRWEEKHGQLLSMRWGWLCKVEDA